MKLQTDQRQITRHPVRSRESDGLSPYRSGIGSDSGAQELYCRDAGGKN